MTLFLTLAPFAAFALLMMLTTAKVSLAAAALVALVLIGWDLLRGRSLKIFSAGALVLFASLFAWHLIARTTPSPTLVRIGVDGGMLVVALASLAIRFPFTLQYAREAVEPEIQERPYFIRINYVLTWVWSAALFLMLGADALTLYLPEIPVWSCAAIAFGARNSASLFTQWYPQHVRAAVEADTLSLGPAPAI